MKKLPQEVPMSHWPLFDEDLEQLNDRIDLVEELKEIEIGKTEYRFCFLCGVSEFEEEVCKYDGFWFCNSCREYF
jgi:hypothetical protein